MLIESVDNLSVVMIAFRNFQKYLNKVNYKENKASMLSSPPTINIANNNKLYLSSRGQQIIGDSDIN